jgi:hypothetical protein
LRNLLFKNKKPIRRNNSVGKRKKKWISIIYYWL